MPGSMRQRGENSWNLRVYAGRDTVTGRKVSIEKTVRGNKRAASKMLAAMVAEVDRRPVASAGKGTMAVLCREWLEHAASGFSPKTVETTRMYIEDPIIPCLGSLPRHEAHALGSRSFLPPAPRGRSFTRSLRPGHHPTSSRHHSEGTGPGSPLGLDHPQSGHRRLASPGADEGAEATGSRSSGEALSSGPGVGPRAGHFHHAGSILGGSDGVSSLRCVGATSTLIGQGCRSNAASSGSATTSSNRAQRRIRVGGYPSMREPSRR